MFKTKQAVLKKILTVLIRQVGDTRECPNCHEVFIPDDRTSNDARELYNELNAKGG